VTRVVLSVGSNVGDRAAHLQSAADALRRWLVAVSPVYETEPFGTEPQPRYLNAVLVADAELGPRAWLEQVRSIEAAAGRTRPRRWAPRTLDVDIVTVAGTVSADPELTLPHPRAHERAFVLAPWADVEPDAVLPGHGAVRELLAGVDTTGVRRRDDLALR
jgi:2-amino-4-hydroxy-6-hydroxymethyldihydropteridine diphosphokinase